MAVSRVCEPLQLSGPEAFYNREDYIEKTTRDFASKKRMPVSYSWNTTSCAKRITKVVLKIIIFPIGLYELLHGLAGLVILPSSVVCLSWWFKNKMHQSRRQIDLQTSGPDGWVYKRITLQFDSLKVDTVIAGQRKNIDNGRWMISVGGNFDFYERTIIHGAGRPIASACDSNIVFFNYPATMCSSGVLPGREKMEKATRGVIRFVCDKFGGLGAKEVIAYAHSIGGGVIGDVISNPRFDPQVPFAILLSRTFCNLAAAAKHLVCAPAASLVKALGWNFKPAEALRRNTCHSIIVQTGEAGFSHHDDIIAAEAALTAGLPVVQDVIWVRHRHNDLLGEEALQRVSSSLDEAFARQAAQPLQIP